MSSLKATSLPPRRLWTVCVPGFTIGLFDLADLHPSPAVTPGNDAHRHAGDTGRQGPLDAARAAIVPDSMKSDSQLAKDYTKGKGDDLGSHVQPEENKSITQKIKDCTLFTIHIVYCQLIRFTPFKQSLLLAAPHIPMMPTATMTIFLVITPLTPRTVTDRLPRTSLAMQSSQTLSSRALKSRRIT